MSGSNYKRVTRKFAARIDHTDGDVSEGFVLVPVGTDFLTTLSQAAGFLHFEMDSGEQTYLSMQAIKRVTELAELNEKAAAAERARRAAEEQAKIDAKRKEEEAKARAEARRKAATTSPYTRKEEFEALDAIGLGDMANQEEIHSTYRRLVKLYHPDRLRGLGVSEKKIAYAANKLAEINNAYRILSKANKAA